MSEKVLLKELLFNKKKVAQIAEELHRVHPSFSASVFVREVVAGFPTRELKARIAWIATCLHTHLPQNYSDAVRILINALPAPNDPTLSDDDFGDFIYAPYAEYVAQYGCTRLDLARSLDALYHMTQRFSAEDAIRYFLNAFPEETLTTLLAWTHDPHYHVRRLCSEGTRPKLPWSQKLVIPHTSPLPILDALYADPTRFVTRSVANHLNDISKINADLVLDTVVRWQESGAQHPKEMAFIIRHALRTLIKQGNPRALALIGYATTSAVQVSGVVVPRTVALNTALVFSCTCTASEDTEVLVDYRIFFQNKAGKMGNGKVYKLTRLSLVKDTPVTVTKRHLLKTGMTTRTLYPGRHELEIQVNGVVYARGVFGVVG
jgi:3-methyladenine DNA glycosylase AlkC